MEKRWFNVEQVRGVSYIYNANFSITGRTFNTDPRAEKDLIVVGYSLKNNSLSTSAGLTVGIPYMTVAGMFGYGDRFVNKDEVSYIYSWEDSLTSMEFKVDEKGLIKEIYVGTDW